MINTIIKAVISFVTTNIDDIFILMLFFSRVNNSLKVRHIVLGQYLGIASLVIISILGALGANLFPSKYIGLLGIVPIYLGIKEYLEYKKGNEDDDEVEEINEKINQENTSKRLISIISVAGVTIANGGDNIGIYIPLFARLSTFEILATSIIFIILTGVWCYIGFKLLKYPFVEGIIERYKHIFVPIVFIALGIYIFIESGTIDLII
ncbi:cadmium resistance transporter [Clostridium cylindrosporum]|uniref:Putative permease, cadmium resistance protein n=1 Tax=Clostridium cylindrosporum DSM 605 TaxID=1121307 RepID=A0A0J8DB56_CLOCY|nr:cadmium resistance transporter [Clostridium cylindrosporum]KMT23310.1 putative permease, cadmium resistance protein [Clostridium cylindrosporum DSM 605]